MSWSRAAVLAVVFALAHAPAAGAQAGALLSFSHDAALDGTAAEIHSGLYAGDDGDDTDGDALADRVANTYETFVIDIAKGTRAHGFTTRITWADPRVDLDLYVYRARDDGRPVGASVAGATLREGAAETATYTAAGPLEPGRYLVVVDNYCSRDADDDPRTAVPTATADCGIGEEVDDEDAFSGAAALDNQPPSVTLDGPLTGLTGQDLRFTAAATDVDGTITGYRFDLDGDDLDEVSEANQNTATLTFEAPGTYIVGVRAFDDGGAAGVATREVTIAKAPEPKPRPPLRSFSLSSTRFGGRARTVLVVRYRLRERARVTVTLYRGSRRVRRISAGVRERRRTYRIVLRPAHLRRGLYTVRIVVRGASGRVQAVKLSARRR